MSDLRQYAPATERNRQPILHVLQEVLPAAGTVLEISSGTGEHITFFASRLSHLQWIASEPNAQARQSIQAWGEALAVKNLWLPPLDLDVSVQPWPLEAALQAGESAAGSMTGSMAGTGLPIKGQLINAIVNINMIHIAPWEMCGYLMAGAEQILPSGGVLYLYGPYKREGQHTAPSNEAFDAMLRDRDPNWGIRNLEAVVAIAQAHSLTLESIIEMPANNLSVVFRRV
jgi:hypothetical protein